jgi:diguanylate cyclase (GGDEF)-like protein
MRRLKSTSTARVDLLAAEAQRGDASGLPPSLRAARRHRVLALMGLTLVALLGAMASAIVFSSNESKARINSNFGLRADSSATFISTFLNEQAAREQQTARRLLSAKHVTPNDFHLVVSSFGSRTAVLLDSKGRLLDVAPSAPALLGKPIAERYQHLQIAERGRIAVSNLVRSAARGEPVTAIAVPFSTPFGRRVFSAAYGVSGSALGSFVEHVVPYSHHVFLVDANNQILAASPPTSAGALPSAAPRLAAAISRANHGPVAGEPEPSTFITAGVPNTKWRLVMEVPDAHLYVSIRGWAQRVPWIVFGLVGVFGIGLLGLLSRSLSDRARLAVLSHKLEETAQTDPLTGLYNRRGLADRLVRTSAHARRREEPFAVLMIDLDLFKQTNDHYGHDAGDRALKAIADCLRAAFRTDEVYGRWGGDEFLVLLVGADKDGATAAAQRLHNAARLIQMSDIGLAEGIELSIGGASGTHSTPEELIERADAALYQSKAAGRGQITIVSVRRRAETSSHQARRL